MSQNFRPWVRPSLRHLFTFEVPLQCLFAPTSLCLMSKIYKDAESLGKSKGLDLDLKTNKGCTIAAQTWPY